MPVYEFVCRECAREFELVQTLREHEKNTVKCPECGSKKVDRVWSTVFVETPRKS